METKNRRSRTIPYLRIASFLVLAVAVVIGGVLAGIRLTHAASSTPELYEVRQGGSIWTYTGGTSWQQIGSANSQTDGLLAGSNALYQLHADGSILRYTGTPLTGWQQLGTANGGTQFSASTDGKIYRTDDTGGNEEVFLGAGRYTNWELLNTTSHKGYFNAGPETIPTGVNCRSVAIGPSSKGVIYTTGSDGVWVFCETSWQQIDTNSAFKVIGTPNGKIYELRFDNTNGGSIWMYTGGLTWKRIDNAQNPQGIEVDGNSTLYQLAKDGTIWSYNGTSWTSLPHNPSSSQVTSFKVSKSGDVFEVLADRSVWAYQAGAWHQIDNSGSLFLITTDTGGWGANYVS